MRGGGGGEGWNIYSSTLDRASAGIFVLEEFFFFFFFENSGYEYALTVRKHWCRPLNETVASFPDELSRPPVSPLWSNDCI